MKTTASELVGAIKEAEGKKTAGYDTTAEVRRITDGTAWVHIPGGVDETPVALTISAEVGDTVQIRVAGGSAWITGNRSKPPTDDTTAVRARGVAIAAQTAADEAQEIAEGVEGIAVDAKETAAEAESKAEDALSQAGASITTDTLHYLATSADSGVTINTPGWTTTVQSMDRTNRYLWTYHTYHKASGQSVNTQPVITGVYGQQGQQGATGPQGPTGPAGSDGDDGVSVTAVQPEYYLSTSASSATGGAWSTSLTYETGKYIWTREHTTYSDSSTGYSSEIYNEALTGACSTAEQALTIAEGVDEHFWFDNTGAHVTQVTQEDWNDSQSAGYHSGGNTLITSGGVAIRNGMAELATFGASGAQIGQAGDYNSRLEIGTDALKIIKSNGNNPEILLSHLGYGTTKYNSSTMPGPFYTLGTRAAGDIGYYSFAEGSNVIASGIYSHAENHATASGSYSHAEGSGTASGSEAHAEGIGTTASGSYSHAEGANTVASGTGAHASGQHTIAQTNYQTVIGAYNVADTGQNPGALGDYVFIIGNGTSDNDGRSNAFTVSWDGNVEMTGGIQSFFKVVDLSWTEPAINAHDHGTTTTHTVPAADRPDGMSLVGIVGWTSANYRIYPYVFHVNGTHSISVTMANATAANSTAATIHVSLLYIKATTA